MAKQTFEYDPAGHSQQLYHSKHRLMNWVHSAHIVEAVKQSSLDSTKRILDAGCSDGEFFVRCEGDYRQAAGLDHNREALKTLSQQRLRDDDNLIVMQGDLCRLPFADQTFDVVCCLETLEHVYDMPQAVAELSRVLKHDGTMIVTVPIERGLSILLKQGVSKLLFGGYRGSYTWPELWSAFMGNMEKVSRPSLSSHKGFDYAAVLREVHSHFDRVETQGLPFKPFGRWLNTQFMMKATKKI